MHQVPVPAQQCLGLDEESVALRPRQQAAQSCEQGPVSRSKRRPGDLPAKDRYFVSENDDFDGEFFVGTLEKPEQLERSDERKVEEGQSHGPVSACRSCRGKSSSAGSDGILGIHRL